MLRAFTQSPAPIKMTKELRNNLQCPIRCSSEIGFCGWIIFCRSIKEMSVSSPPGRICQVKRVKSWTQLKHYFFFTTIIFPPSQKIIRKGGERATKLTFQLNKLCGHDALVSLKKQVVTSCHYF